MKKTINMGEMPAVLPKEYLISEISELYANGLPQGLLTSVSNLDDTFRLDRGRLVTVTGIPNHGKSEFVDFLTATYNKKYGMKTLYFSPENQPLSFHMAKLVSKFTNKRLKDSTPEEVRDAASYICDNFFFCNYSKISKLSQIISITERLIEEQGVSILVLDAYNKIESEKPTEQIETEFISKVLDTLCRLAIKNNILVILVAHPRKMTKDFSSDSYYIPNAYDINGSAHFFNKSDFVFTVHRDFKNEETIIKCDKVKYHNYGSQGECRLKYDFASGNYYNTQSEDGYFHSEELEYKPIEFSLPIRSMSDPLDVEVSVYNGVTDTVGYSQPLCDFLFTDKYKAIAAEIRGGSTPEERHAIKEKHVKNLPCAAISARFSERSKGKVISYSGLLSIDIDYKDNKEVIMQVPSILSQLDYILYAGKSITGDGYFAICRIDNPNNLKQHFLALEQEFKGYGITIDKACKDVTRLRFASYDEDPYYNPNASTYYKVVEDDEVQPKQVKPSKFSLKYSLSLPPSQSSAETVERHIKYIQEHNLSFPDDYPSWFSAGMSLSSEFGEGGRTYFHSISSMSPKYNSSECDKQYDRILEAYGSNNKYSLGTLINMFREAEGNN